MQRGKAFSRGKEKKKSMLSVVTNKPPSQWSNTGLVIISRERRSIEGLLLPYEWSSGLSPGSGSVYSSVSTPSQNDGGRNDAQGYSTFMAREIKAHSPGMSVPLSC